METKNNYWTNGANEYWAGKIDKIAPIDGCGIDDSSELFYESGKHASEKEAQERLEDLAESEELN